VKRKFVIYTDHIKENAVRAVAEISPGDTETMVVEIKPLQKAKTIAQLGTLFGLWGDQLLFDYGLAKDEFHIQMKAKFLAPIYAREPWGDMQEWWVEDLIDLQERGQHRRLDKHMDRLSLRWASVNQMSEYMRQVEAHWIGLGVYLRVPDKFSRAMKARALTLNS